MKKVLSNVMVTMLVAGLSCSMLTGCGMVKSLTVDKKKEVTSEVQSENGDKSQRLPEGVEKGDFTAHWSIEGSEDEAYADLEYTLRAPHNTCCSAAVKLRYNVNAQIEKVTLVNSEGTTYFYCEYDADGELKNIEAKKDGKKVRNVSVSENKVVEEFFDKGETYTYNLDEHRIVTKIHVKTNTDETEYEFPMEYAYYDDGNIKSITANTYDRTINTDSIICRIENLYGVHGVLKYDKNGRKEKDIAKDENADIKYSCEWKYDDNGWCTQEIVTNNGEETVYNWEYSN